MLFMGTAPLLLNSTSFEAIFLSSLLIWFCQVPIKIAATTAIIVAIEEIESNTLLFSLLLNQFQRMIIVYSLDSEHISNWLPIRDSNPNNILQRDVSYR